MTGESLSYLTIFFNSILFRFCYKEYFPELLGESRELRKVFFEKLNVKPIQDDGWYSEILEEIILRKSAGLSISELEKQINDKLFDLYNLSIKERDLILSKL